LNAHAQSVLSIDAEDDVLLLSTSGSNGTAGSAFETFNRTIAQQIQKIVLGQTLTSGTDGKGSYALGQVHENVRADKLKSDMRLVRPTLQAVVDALCELNNWAEHTIVLGEEAKVLNTEQAERDTRLKNAGANFSDAYFIREYGLQEGDLKPVEQSTFSNAQFSVIPRKAFSFAAGTKKLSADQQEVEGLTDGQDDLQLLTNEQIRQLAADSETPEALLFNLSRLIPGATQSQFTANLDQALFAADVLGYATAAKGK
jgi:phage gp29-like protein